ncbi:hypothetical protein [Gibbsiella quercinecans]|uniref:hypothetical protein n=1 Tax=Gibbsiella quercinecans TaxID=929813 RepID=UPI0011C3BE71|nr:hypothetical protein [Gibbsiella quercinecans]
MQASKMPSRRNKGLKMALGGGRVANLMLFMALKFDDLSVPSVSRHLAAHGDKMNFCINDPLLCAV